MMQGHTGVGAGLLAAAAMTLTTGMLLGACTGEKLDEAKDKVEQTKADVADAIAAKIEAELLDYVQCQGVTNAAVLDGISKLIKDRKRLSATDLIAAPDGVAELVESGVDGREVARVAAEVFRELVAQEAVSTATETGLQGRKCHDKIKVPCLLGSAEGVVLCDAADKPVGVQISAKACELGKYRLDGTVVAEPAAQPAGGVNLMFADFGIDKARKLTGEVALSGKLSKDAVHIAASSKPNKALVIKEHGGHDSKLSCGRTVEVAAMELTVSAVKLSAALDIKVRAPGRTVQLRADPGELVWTFADKCPCPDNGSTVVATVPRPGGEGDKDTISVAALFGAGGADRCRSVKTKISGWPTDCSAKDAVTSACGETPRDAAQTVSAALASELCVSL